MIDASIINVNFNNINSIEKKINKAFEILNKLGQRMSIVISAGYLNLKMSEYICAMNTKAKSRPKKKSNGVLENR